MDDVIDYEVFVVSVGNEIDGRIVWQPHGVFDSHQAAIDHEWALRKYGPDGRRVAFVRVDTYGYLDRCVNLQHSCISQMAVL